MRHGGPFDHAFAWIWYSFFWCFCVNIDICSAFSSEMLYLTVAQWQFAPRCKVITPLQFSHMKPTQDKGPYSTRRPPFACMSLFEVRRYPEVGRWDVFVLLWKIFCNPAVREHSCDFVFCECRNPENNTVFTLEAQNLNMHKGQVTCGTAKEAKWRSVSFRRVQPIVFAFWVCIWIECVFKCCAGMCKQS